MTSGTSDYNNNIPQAYNPSLYKIVLTGGPCGGKTTAIARLSSYLRERGFEVLTCPEAYSILVTNGMSPGQYFASGIPGIGTAIQNTVLDLQISLEDGFQNVLRARGKPSVLLCDRGLMDGSAYMSAEEWEGLLNSRGMESVCDLREGRYDAVFHLVTAAEGAEKFYSLENNEVRTETAEEARDLDCKTRGAWVGHPRLCVFDNSTDFEGKLQKLVNATAKLVGLPSELRRETTKFLLKNVPDLSKFPKDVRYHVFDVEKIYLYDDTNKKSQKNHTPQHHQHHPIPAEYDEEYSFIRKRTHQNGLGSVYGQTTVKRTKSGQRIELKRIITQREYASLIRTRDATRHIVRQTRISFLYKVQSFNVHIYKEPANGLCILHCQVEVADEGKEESEEDLPPFLEVERKLRNDREDNEKYGAFNISLIDK